MLDLQRQSAVIAGSYLLSLSVLGRPAGLVKNIGGGVQNFFYEPYEGALQSPKDFVIGIGKGTTGLGRVGATSRCVPSLRRPRGLRGPEPGMRMRPCGPRW